MLARPAHLLNWIKPKLARVAERGGGLLAASGVATTFADQWWHDYTGARGDHPRHVPSAFESAAALQSQLRAVCSIPDGRCVVTMTGASQAITLVFLAIHEQQPAGEVVVVAPLYDPLCLIPQRLGMPVRRIEHPDLEGSLDASIGPRTAAVVWANPNNPLGTSLDPATRQRMIAKIAGRAPQATIVEDIAFGEFHPSGIAGLQAMEPNVVQIGTISKGLGLGRVRCGWVSWDDGSLPQMQQTYDLYFNTGAILTEMAATAALLRAAEFRDAAQQQVDKNLPIISHWTSSAAAEVLIKSTTVTRSTICFAELPGIEDSFELCEQLDHQFGVLVAPGTYFGRPEGIRIGFGGDAAALETGLARLAAGLRALR